MVKSVDNQKKQMAEAALLYYEKKYTQQGIPIKFGIFRKEDVQVDLDPVRWIRQQAAVQES